MFVSHSWNTDSVFHHLCHIYYNLCHCYSWSVHVLYHVPHPVSAISCVCLYVSICASLRLYCCLLQSVSCLYGVLYSAIPMSLVLCCTPITVCYTMLGLPTSDIIDIEHENDETFLRNHTFSHRNPISVITSYKILCSGLKKTSTITSAKFVVAHCSSVCTLRLPCRTCISL